MWRLFISILKIFLLITDIENVIAKTTTTKTTTTTTKTTTTITTTTTKICTYGTGSNGSSCVQCGVASFTPNIRIIGGIPSVPNSWPSQVLIVMDYVGLYRIGWFTLPVSQRSVCSGTLITPKVVMTAAHCISTSMSYNYMGNQLTLPISPNRYYPTWESMFTIYAGVNDISFLSSNQLLPPTGKAMNVSKIMINENFNTVNNQNDIALFSLSRPFTLNSVIQIACLPRPSITQPFLSFNSFVYAAGWGLTNPNTNSQIPSVQYNVKLKVYNSTYCSNYQSGLINFDNQLCVGNYDGSEGPCEGDSGSAIFSYDQEIQKYIVVGITSFGTNPCAMYGYPGVYTKVSSYLSWIYVTLSKLAAY